MEYTRAVTRKARDRTCDGLGLTFGYWTKKPLIHNSLDSARAKFLKTSAWDRGVVEATFRGTRVFVHRSFDIL